MSERYTAEEIEEMFDGYHSSLAGKDCHIADLQAQVDAKDLVLTAAAEREAACAPYLKDGETPAECIERNRKDADATLTLLAADRAALAEAQREIARLRTQVSEAQDAEDAARNATLDLHAERQKVAALREKALKFYLWLLVTRTKLPWSPEGRIEARAWGRIVNEMYGESSLITMDEARAIHRDVAEGRDTIASALALGLTAAESTQGPEKCICWDLDRTDCHDAPLPRKACPVHAAPPQGAK